VHVGEETQIARDVRCYEETLAFPFIHDSTPAV